MTDAWNLNLRYVKAPNGRRAAIHDASRAGEVVLIIPAKECRAAYRNHKPQYVTIQVPK